MANELNIQNVELLSSVDNSVNLLAEQEGVWKRVDASSALATKQYVESELQTHGVEIAGILNGVNTVKKAEQDKNGNQIDTTYETKQDANTHKLDSSVHLTQSDKDNITYASSNMANIISGQLVVPKANEANSATSAGWADMAQQDAYGHNIGNYYETKDDASSKLGEAKQYADQAATNAATAVKNELLNGAGGAYDTLKELGDLIDDNTDAIDALETVAASKVGVSDIVDDLKTANASKVLSANQGVRIKTLLDSLESEVNTYGDELEKISNCSLDATKNMIGGWTLGRLTTSTIQSSTYRAYSPKLPIDQETLYYFDDTKYKLCFCAYKNPEDELISATSSWFEVSPAVNPLNPGAYSKMALQLQALDTSMKINVATDIDVYTLSEGGTSSVIVEKVLNNEANIESILNGDGLSKIVYVSTAGSDENDGSKDAPFKTIQKAVDVNAEIIKVYAGEYEPVIISDKKHPITIMLANQPTYSASTEEQDLPKIKISNANQYTGIHASNCTELHFYDIWCDNVARSPFYLTNCGYVECFRCYASNNSVENFGGFRIVNCNGVFTDCKAWNITLDGFNIHGYGNTEFINCVAYDCGDDGISHHDSCTGLILGGEYYRNGKGGISSPYGGAKIDIHNVYSHDNTRYGLYADSDATHPLVYARVSNSVFANNGTSDIYVADGTMISWNNKYDTIDVKDTATYTLLSEYITEAELNANGFAKQTDLTLGQIVPLRAGKAEYADRDKNGNMIHETYALKSDVDNLSDEIVDLGGTPIPSYWEEYLTEKIETIRALQDEAGKDGFSFIVMTDSHVCCQEGYEWKPISPTIAKKVADECDIKYVLYLGDVNHRGCYTLKSQLERDNLWINGTMFKPIRDKLLRTQGNHDGNYGTLDRDGDGTISNYSDGVIKSVEDRETFVYSLTDGENHRQIYRKVGMVGDVHFDESGTGYWIDDVSNEVRYIMLNTHNTKYELRDDGTQKYPSMWLFRFQQSQYDMVIEALNSIPSDSWAVVIGGHVPLDKSGEVSYWGGTNDDDSDCGLMKKMLTAYKNKTTFNGTFEGTAGGSGMVANFTNRVDLNSDDFVDNHYMTVSSTSATVSTSENADYCVTNYIAAICPNKVADEVRIKGHDLNSLNDIRWACYNSNKELIFAGSSGTKPDFATDENGVTSWKVGMQDNYVSTSNANAIAFVRFSFKKATTKEDIIITVNEEIAYTESGTSVGGYDSVSVNCDFTSAKGNLVGFFGGHKHIDESYVDGINIIITRCDGFQHENTDALKNERVKGTYTEYSFDVFTVNKKTGIAHATKIGAGVDRTIEYTN